MLNGTAVIDFLKSLWSRPDTTLTKEDKIVMDSFPEPLQKAMNDSYGTFKFDHSPVKAPRYFSTSTFNKKKKRTKMQKASRRKNRA